MKVILEAENLCKTYLMGEVQVEALKNASFQLYAGELVVVLGPSGSGKSTLLNIMGGMDRASAGTLFFNDTSLHDADPRKLTLYRRNDVGFVFQFYNLMPNLTAHENISLAAQISRDPFSIDELLGEVGLANRATHFPAQLSGGEQQRIALARALVKNPTMMLCDEPTGALDYQTSIHILKLLKDFCVRYQKTVVLITHNTAIAQMAGRIFHLKDGMIERIETNQDPLPPEKVTW